MSMENYPVFGSGLVISLDSSEGNYLLTKLLEEDDPDASLSECDSCDIEEIIYNLCPNGRFVALDEASSVDFFPMGSDGDIEFRNSSSLIGDFVLVSPDGIQRFFGTPYQTADDLIAELKKLVGKYLPDDFNYRSHIGMLAGCCFG